ncbi:unnamed protein product, partial [Rhizoctonia solani]
VGCWISGKYKAQRFGAEYVWLWISGFGSILLYIPLFLIMRGNIMWDPIIGWKSLRWSWRKDDIGVNSLIWYPLTYTITVLPVSIVRWISFNGGHVDAAVVFVAASIFNLSGLVNVGLILFTRTGVFLLGPRVLGGIDPRLVDTEPLGGDYMQEHETGFGGVRVVNQRDSSIIGENIHPGRGDISSGGLGFKSVSRGPLVDPSSEGAAGESGPGRAYLESLGFLRGNGPLKT